MVVDLSRVLGSALKFSWRRRWLWVLGMPVSGGQSGGITYEILLAVLGGILFGVAVGLKAIGFGVWLIVAVDGVLLALALAGMLVVAAAAEAGVIWGVLQLDAGYRPGLTEAWRQGWARKGRLSGVILVRLALVVLPIVLLFAVILAIQLVVGLAGGGPARPGDSARSCSPSASWWRSF